MDPVSAQNDIDAYHLHQQHKQAVIISYSVARFTIGLSISVTPTLFRNVALTHICEVEEIEGCLYPSLHLMDFRDGNDSPTHRRIPLITLTSTLDVGGLENGLDWFRAPKLVVHSWDGKDTILVSYPGEMRFGPRSVWLVKLDAGVVGFLDKGDCSA